MWSFKDRVQSHAYSFDYFFKFTSILVTANLLNIALSSGFKEAELELYK